MRLLSLLLLGTTLPAATYFPPPDAEGGWRTTKDAAEARALAGIDLARLEQAARAAERSNADNGGLLVVSKGYLVLERYYGKAHRNANPDMASTGKAFTSIACGVMLQEFKAKLPDGLDTKVYTQEFLPEAFPLRDPREADIRLGHLLCMTSGHNGEGATPSAVVRGATQALKPAKGQDIHDIDGSSLRTPLWAGPGEGYSYSSPAPHIASMVLRRVTGKELPAYLDEKFAQPMGWGPWGYCLYRGDVTMAHANGAGSIALRATDAVRFGYCLAQGGRWRDRQLIPADYLKLCQQALPYNPHFPFSLQFEHNQAGQILGAPRDAFYKTGANGFCLYIVPSLDLVIYKLGGKDGQWNPDLTRIPQPPDDFGVHTSPGPTPKNGSYETYSIPRILELVCGATIR
ncbi:MAG: class C beta-lactamase-related serine hydrolase [Verrucomicrobia bacterium]|nr:class C beta-lactamase-related serine hydrolase [Verrucomicrobiota bacterium]